MASGERFEVFDKDVGIEVEVEKKYDLIPSVYQAMATEMTAVSQYVALAQTLMKMGEMAAAQVLFDIAREEMHHFGELSYVVDLLREQKGSMDEFRKGYDEARKIAAAFGARL